MPRATGFPRRRLNGRAIVISIAMVIFFVLVFGRAIARFYVEGLWYLALGRGDVFWGQVGSRVLLFVVFFLVFCVLALVNLYVADRVAPVAFPANVHPFVERFHELFGHRLRAVRYTVATLFAVALAAPASAEWQSWLLFRHATSFGQTDPQFGRDVGFYVFRLPFIAFTIDWLFAALIVVLLITIAAHLLNGDVVFMSSTPVIRSAMKVHIAVLLAVLAIVKAADYWISRFELTNETRGFVQGATYTVVKAELPARTLLTMIALLTAVLYLVAVRNGRWRIPLVASGLWLVVLLVGGVVYPALVQSLVVRPNQESREAPYIARNVAATRVAMGINDVSKQEVTFGRLDTAAVEADVAPFRNVRLLNPEAMLSRFSLDRGAVAGLKIADLDVNRTTVDGREQQILITARELDVANLPNKSWQGLHLVSTRGCGLVSAPASSVDSEDRPIYSSPKLDRPELYFSPAISGYAITRTDVQESPCAGSSNEPYAGTGGVTMSSVARKLALATAFLDYNFLLSGAINSDSELLWVRSVTDRVEKLAPFLHYDGDPYPVEVDGGVQWVIDAYTATTNYPYAQRIGNVQLSASTGLSPSSNYIRNSVKAVVDAYTGGVTFYVVDESDPILQAWRSAYPKLFTSANQMPEQLRASLRYPEDLFRVQTDVYSKYQLDPDVFFQRTGAWSVAQAPSVQARVGSSSAAGAENSSAAAADFATESNVKRFTPYYTVFQTPDGSEQFVIVRPFVPFSSNDDRTELQAYMTASSDPASYGQLTSYIVENVPLPEGPKVVASKMESEQAISSELTQQDNTESGTSVVFGDLQLLPVGNDGKEGLVYVRPFYVVSNNGAEFRYVIVSHNSNAALGCDLGSALQQLFPGFNVTIGDRLDDQGRPLPPASCGNGTSTGTSSSGGNKTGTGGSTGGSDSTEGSTTGTTPPLGDNATAAELIAQAETLFAQADERLRAGDLAGYQQLVNQGVDLVARANALLNQ